VDDSEQWEASAINRAQDDFFGILESVSESENPPSGSQYMLRFERAYDADVMLEKGIGGGCRKSQFLLGRL